MNCAVNYYIYLLNPVGFISLGWNTGDLSNPRFKIKENLFYILEITE